MSRAEVAHLKSGIKIAEFAEKSAEKRRPRWSRLVQWAIVAAAVAAWASRPCCDLRVPTLGAGDADGAVRFAGGSTDAGTLEVYHDGRWGTVCAQDAKALGVAHVACRQLGFGLATGTMLMPGGETAARWLSGVACDGTEVGIGGCGHAGWGVADTCDGALGVRCLACEGEQCDAYAAAVRLCDLRLTSHLPARARAKRPYPHADLRATRPSTLLTGRAHQRRGRWCARANRGLGEVLRRRRGIRRRVAAARLRLAQRLGY